MADTNIVKKDLGPVSAYAIAVKHGYKGTEEEWAALQIASAENAKAADASAKEAAETLAAVHETVEQETTAAVAAVNNQKTASIQSVKDAAQAAGDYQEERIAVKGEETLASIPDDYTKLGRGVAALTEEIGLYDIGTTYNTLDASYNRVMAVYPIKNVDSVFNFVISEKSTNDSVIIRVCSAPSPYSESLLQIVAAMNPEETRLTGSFVIDDDVKDAAKYIIVLCPSAGSLVSFRLELFTEASLTEKLKATAQTTNLLNSAVQYNFESYEQGGVDATTGNIAESSNVVRTGFMRISDIAKVSLAEDSGMHVQMYAYDIEQAYIGRTDLGTEGFENTNEDIAGYRSYSVYVVFAIYNEAGGALSPYEVQNSGKFVLTLTAISTVARMNEQTNTQFANLLNTVGKTPMASWVDDDGVVLNNNGVGIANTILPAAEAVGVPVTFAVIPPLDEQVTVDGETMTKAEYYRNLQRQGHQITAHPTHDYWYGDNYDLQKVNPSLIDCLVELQNNGFLHSDMLVYPGGSSEIKEVVEIVKRWCVCGVLSGYGTPNHLGDSTKWRIKRTFVNFENYNELHASDDGYISAMEWYKSQVDSAYANGDWIVFGSHAYQFTDSDDTSDPNANTRGNLLMLMQYVVDKGLEFRTLWDAYNRRKYLFDFKEINM